jgi:hypothetical protein
MLKLKLFMMMLFAVQAAADGLLCSYSAFRDQLSIPYLARALEISGEYAFVTTQANGMLVYAYSAQGIGEQLDQVPLAGPAFDICVVGSFAYVTTYGGTLQVVQIDAGGNGSVVGSLPLSFGARFVEPISDTELIAGASSGLYLVNISDPANPVLMDTHSQIGIVYRVLVLEDELFVLSSANILRYSISKDGSLTETARVAYPFSTSIAFHENYVYVSKSNEPIRVYEVTGEGGLEYVFDFEVSDRVVELHVAGDMLFATVNDYFEGVYSYELTAGFEPTLNGFVSVDQTPVHVVATSQLVHTLTSDGVYTHDVAGWNPNPLVGVIAGNDVEQVELTGNGYLAFSQDATNIGVYQFESSQDEWPASVGSVALQGTPTQLDAGAQYVAAALGEDGVAVIDPEADGGPLVVYEQSGVAIHSVLMDGERLFASGPDGLTVIDLGTISAPEVLGTSGIEMSNLCIAGGYLVTGQPSGVMEVFDISDLQNVVSVAMLELPKSAPGIPPSIHGITADDEYVYLATSHSGVYIVPIDSLMDPVVVGQSETSDQSESVEVVGSLLCVAENEGNVQVYDTTIVTSPERVGFYALQGLTCDLVVRNDIVFAADLNVGVVGLRLGQGCGCPADIDNDDSLTFFDVSAFLVGFQTQDSIADWNSDGVWNFFDVSGFLEDYLAGCP